MSNLGTVLNLSTILNVRDLIEWNYHWKKGRRKLKKKKKNIFPFLKKNQPEGWSADSGKRHARRIIFGAVRPKIKVGPVWCLKYETQIVSVLLVCPLVAFFLPLCFRNLRWRKRRISFVCRLSESSEKSEFGGFLHVFRPECGVPQAAL